MGKNFSAIRTTSRYWLTCIIWPSVRDSFSIAELWNKLTLTILGFVAGVLAVTGLGFSGNIPNFGFNLTTAGLVLFGTIAFRIIVSMVYLPAKLYEEKVGFIDNPFELAPINEDYSTSNDQWVSIEVRNKSKVDNIEDCFLRLTDIVNLETNQTIESRPKTLTWSAEEHREGQDGKQDIVVRAGYQVVCDVTHYVSQSETAYYTTRFAGYTQYTEINPGEYRLTIKAHGIWQGHSIDPVYSVELSYGDNTLKLGKIVEQTSQ